VALTVQALHMHARRDVQSGAVAWTVEHSWSTVGGSGSRAIDAQGLTEVPTGLPAREILLRCLKDGVERSEHEH
jgi:hypothetical protein